jgi:hypothetical protein
LQTFFFRVGLALRRIDPTDDMDLLLSHCDPRDQGPHHLAFAEPVCVLQPRIHLGRQVLQAANDPPDFRLKGRHIDELLTVLLQLGDALPQAGDTGFERVLFP